VDWQTALEYVGNGLRDVIADHGPESVGALVSPHSTLEELYLAKQLVNGLGSDNIDHRLRAAEFEAGAGVRWLGTSIASLSTLQSALVVGSNIRKDHPLFAQRIRQAVRKGGCSVNAINAVDYDWAMGMGQVMLAPASRWAAALAEVAAAVAAQKNVAAPVPVAEAGAQAKAIAAALVAGERKAILLGNAAAHHAKASSLLALAQWIGAQTGASVGYLTEAANTVGAQWVGAQPQRGGLNAAQMLVGGLKAAVLFNTEPEFDSAAGAAAAQALSQVGMVVTLSPFKANMAFSDVLLPIAPFTETSGTFVNAEGRIQGFHAVVKPLGDTRPGWKVLRVLGNLLEIPGMDWETSQDVLSAITGAPAGELDFIAADKLDNSTQAPLVADTGDGPEPVSASIYQLDGLVRRAHALQMTADARVAREGGAA
jgi:NADH-quinone oxidoreductase subunit G